MSLDPWQLDRDRGFLTEADREYLLGESNVEPQSHTERKTRERIRNRAKNCLMDFAILFKHLEDRDRKQIFDSKTNTSSATPISFSNFSDDGLRQGMVSCIAFLLQSASGEELLSDYTTLSVGGDTHDEYTPIAEQMLEDAIHELAYKTEYTVHDFHLEVDAVHSPVQGILERLRSGEKVPPNELQKLLLSEIIDSDELREFIRTQVQEK